MTVDVDAAGWGWFVDRTPRTDHEFGLLTEAGLLAMDGPAAGRMDLLSVLAHEYGHALVLEHAEEGVMDDTLSAGLRTLPTVSPRWVTAQAPAMFGQRLEGEGGIEARRIEIDWTVPATTPARPAAVAAMSDAARRDDVGWQSRFVNELGARSWKDMPNQQLVLHLPTSSPLTHL
jgi:hypothetical protein